MFPISTSLPMTPATIGQKVKKFSLEMTITPTSSRSRVRWQRVLAAVYPPNPPPKTSTLLGNSLYGGFSQGLYLGRGSRALRKAPAATVAPPAARAAFKSLFTKSSRDSSRGRDPRLQPSLLYSTLTPARAL